MRTVGGPMQPWIPVTYAFFKKSIVIALIVILGISLVSLFIEIFFPSN